MISNICCIKYQEIKGKYKSHKAEKRYKYSYSIYMVDKVGAAIKPALF